MLAIEADRSLQANPVTSQVSPHRLEDCWNLFLSGSVERWVLVFAEATKGPFVKADMQNAPWAPGPNDTAAGRAFIAALAGQL